MQRDIVETQLNPLAQPRMAAIVWDRARTTSLTLHAALADAGLEPTPRLSLDQLEATLKSQPHVMAVLAVSSIGSVELNEIGRMRALTDAPILVMSETEDPAMRAAALEAGADEHVGPFMARSEVHARIQAKLRRHLASPGFNQRRTV